MHVSYQLSKGEYGVLCPSPRGDVMSKRFLVAVMIVLTVCLLAAVPAGVAISQEMVDALIEIRGEINF